VPVRASARRAIVLDTSSRFQRIEDFLNRHALALAVALILIATIRVGATYTVFSHTNDEPYHIAAGMEWLSKGAYTYEHQHPPLARVMAALGPYLAGARSNGLKDQNLEGSTILYGGGHYDLRLALARAGNLPFFWLACWITFLWAGQMMDSAGAVIALFIFTMIPSILAHAGLATTDIAATASFAAASYALLRLLQSPGLRTGLWLGAALGLMIATKFSSLVFYPAALALAVPLWSYSARPALVRMLQHFRLCLPWFLVAVGVSFALTWSVYRFSFGTTPGIPFPVPFPELFSGIGAVARHNDRGHLSYFLGELRTGGWLLFFPVLLAVKLPLAMIGLIVLGYSKRVDRSQDWAFPVLIAVPAAILAVAMASRINIGLRHILPAFPFLAIAAAAGARWLLRQGRERGWIRWTAGLAIGWLSITSLAAHPDYLPYFNALAGDHPEKIVVDSDLDWGQDIKRLGQRLRELNAPSVTFTPTVIVSLAAHGFPPHEQSAVDTPSPGWNAVQLSEWKLFRMGLQLDQPELRPWPDFVQPTERVGRTILLYYVPPQPNSQR